MKYAKTTTRPGYGDVRRPPPPPRLTSALIAIKFAGLSPSRQIAVASLTDDTSSAGEFTGP